MCFSRVTGARLLYSVIFKDGFISFVTSDGCSWMECMTTPVPFRRSTVQVSTSIQSERGEYGDTITYLFVLQLVVKFIIPFSYLRKYLYSMSWVEIVWTLYTYSAQKSANILQLIVRAVESVFHIR